MSEETSGKSRENLFGTSLFARLQVVVGILLSVVAAYSAWQLNGAEKSLKETERVIKARDADRKDAEEIRANRESIEKKQLMVYEAVVKSLEGEDLKKQSVAKALVTSILEDPLRTELLSVLTTSSSPEIRLQAQETLSRESTFKAEQGAVQAAPSQKAPATWADWDFDIFWCESSGEIAKGQAESIKAQLVAEGAKGRLRVRLLPDSINARPGYQHTGYAIRYNRSEENQANQLKTLSDKIVGPDGAFLTTLSGQSTPWYLSAFVCPATN